MAALLAPTEFVRIKMRRQRICRTTFWPATPGSVAGEIQSPHREWSLRNTHAFASSLGSTRSSGRTVTPSTLRPCNLDDCTGKSVPSYSSSLCTDHCSNPCRWTPCSCRLRAYTSSLVPYRLLYRAHTLRCQALPSVSAYLVRCRALDTETLLQRFIFSVATRGAGHQYWPRWMQRKPSIFQSHAA